MRTYTHAAGIIAFALLATPAIAQELGSCSAGPGAAFGVVGYQCANCSYSRSGLRPSFTFMAEPLVLEVRDGSNLRAGDVIEAVNGKPITTSAGSEQFVYPPTGENSITVRRGRDHQTIRVTLPDAEWKELCAHFARGVGAGVGAGFGRGAGTGTGSGVGTGTGSGFGSGVGTGAGGAAGAGVGAGGPPMPRYQTGYLGSVRIRGTPQLDTVPLIIIDGAVVQNGTAGPPGSLAAARTGKYGFAVACEPSCTAATDRDGPLMYTYYKYDEAPPIVAIRAGSPTERAGVKIGDVLLKIDGRSILEADGALALARIDKKESIRLTVRRDGKEVEYLISVTK